MNIRVIKSIAFWVIVLIQSIQATYNFPSFGQTVERKPSITVQAYYRHPKQNKKYLDKKLCYINQSVGVCLAVADKQKLNTELKNFNRALLQAKQDCDQEREEKYCKRIKALKSTLESDGAIKDYAGDVPYPFIVHTNNMNMSFVGTDIDQCLHEELCKTQQRALRYLNADPKNIHAQHIVPLIIDTTIQAKQEQEIAVAFANADVAEQLISVIEYTNKTICAIGRGIEKSLYTITSFEHWKEMAIGIKNVAIAVIKSVAEQELFEDAHCCYDKNISNQLLQLYEYKTERQKRELYHYFVNRYKTLKELSLTEGIELGTELAMTLLLDTVMLNAASWVATTAGRTTIATIEKALYGGVAEQYTAELIGLSRVVVTKDEYALIKLFCEFDQDAALVNEVGFLPSDYLRKELDLVHPSTPVNRIGMKDPLKVMKGMRKSTIINGRKYCDHAFESMQERGFTPITIEAVIKN